MSQLSDKERLQSLLKTEWTNQTTSTQNIIVQGLSPAPTLKELLPAEPGPSHVVPSNVLHAPEEQVVRRFKPPLDYTSKHDVRGDALSVCYDLLIQRRVPVWAAHLIAHAFMDQQDVQEQFKIIKFKLDDGEYERVNAISWCQNFINRFHKFMIDLRDEKYELPEKPPQCDQWPFAFSAMKNKKPKMEDRHIIVPSFACIEPDVYYDRRDDAFFAVFDGHNGHEVAAYLASHFHRFFLEPLNDSPDPMERLKKTYEFTDKMLDLRCQKENYKGGSTAVGVLISQRHLFFFWCGDASIGIFSNGHVRTLSKQHVPSNKDEYNRVIAAGGTIVNVNGELRVNGVLNITRSMGEKFGKPMISSQPDMADHQLSDNDWVLFLASDGVWDEMLPSDVLDYCVEFANRYSSDNYIHLADYIVMSCRHAGARDNLTLIIVFLKPVEKVWSYLQTFLPKQTRKL